MPALWEGGWARTLSSRWTVRMMPSKIKDELSCPIEVTSNRQAAALWLHGNPLNVYHLHASPGV